VTRESTQGNDSGSETAGEHTQQRLLSVIVPVLDEVDALVELHQRLTATLSATDTRYELIFVDDGSSDGTFERLLDLSSADPRLRVLSLRRRFGKARALMEGVDAARGDVIASIDGDLQDQPEEIPNLLARLDEGYDLVCAWRRKRNDPAAKLLASRLFNAVTARLGGVALHDINCGLKVMRREVADAIEMRGELHRYLPIIAQWEGFAVTEVAVSHAARPHGRTKYGRERFLRGFLDLLTTLVLTRYLTRPAHLFGGIGLGLALVGVAITVYLVIGRLMHWWWLTDRPLLLLGTLLIIVGVQFMFFGLLAEMVAHTRKLDAVDPVKFRGP
jgi:glycosyltransferase involved in cell wall biosynthesis